MSKRKVAHLIAYESRWFGAFTYCGYNTDERPVIRLDNRPLCAKCRAAVERLLARDDKLREVV